MKTEKKKKVEIKVVALREGGQKRWPIRLRGWSLAYSISSFLSFLSILVIIPFSFKTRKATIWEWLTLVRPDASGYFGQLLSFDFCFLFNIISHSNVLSPYFLLLLFLSHDSLNIIGGVFAEKPGTAVSYLVAAHLLFVGGCGWEQKKKT